jgi:hypothetical protein
MCVAATSVVADCLPVLPARGVQEDVFAVFCSM